MNKYVSKVIGSPVGPLKLVASDDGLAAILWKDDSPRRVRLGNVVQDETNSILLETERQLGEYFAGQRKVFTVKLDFAGTDFQRRVWTALLTIPYGETRSYLQIAGQIGSPAAVRAVGAANGRNPISIIAPCHRVVGSTGKLTGFAAGLEVKARLLALEAGEGVSRHSRRDGGTRPVGSRAACKSRCFDNSVGVMSRRLEKPEARLSQGGRLARSAYARRRHGRRGRTAPTSRRHHRAGRLRQPLVRR
jgi:methylated-DNA-[protein]-cysteine S-methyltransferase